MPAVNFTHPDGTTESIDQTQAPEGEYAWFWAREIGEMDKLKIRVDRADAKALDQLERKGDEVELSGVYTGRLIDIEKGGPYWTLVVYGFEWDANKHAPTAGGVLRTQTDAAHMDQFINSVSEWSIGTTTALTGQVDYVFNHALAHEGMRRVERGSPGELRWRADQSVDYLDRLGSDKSASVTLTPDNTNIEGELRVVNRGRTMDATHVRLIGAHEGEAQVETNLVPSGDSGTFTNEVTYTTSRWSDASDTDWTRWSNKDLTTQAAIDAAAEALADELVDSHVEVKATVVGEDLVLGDTVHVTKSEADIDLDMRVKRIETRQVGATVYDEVLLSTRNLASDTENERVRDNTRYNVAFQGSAVWGTLSGGYQAVSSSVNYILGAFDYPDVPFEHDVTLWVKSVPYKTFSSGAAASGGDTTENNADFDWTQQNAFDKVQTLPADGSISPFSFSPNVTTSEVRAFGGINVDGSDLDGTLTEISFQLENTTTGETFPSGGTPYNLQFNDSNESGWAHFRASDPTDCNGDTLEITYSNLDSKDLTVRVTEYWEAIGPHTHGQTDHTHPNDPGVSEFANTTATGVDVLVNGVEEATDIGTGEFETTVDLTGKLTKGAFNTVELASDTTGGLIASLSVDAYRKIGGNA